MKRHAAWMMIALFIGAALTACAVQQKRNEPASSEVLARIARELQLQEPRYAGALLHNIRAVLERGSMTSRLFFSDEQLKATFGGSTVEWIQNTPTNVHCRLGPLAYLPVRSPEIRVPKVGFLWWNASPSVPEKPAGNFSFVCDCNLTNTDIEAVFGDVDRIVDRDRRFDRSHYPVPPRATHPLGNKVVRYTLRGPEGYISSFEVHYDPQGRVAQMAGRTDPVPATLSVDAQSTER
jgi:hypothetical protein